jgi:hypothetical protein
LQIDRGEKGEFRFGLITYDTPENLVGGASLLKSISSLVGGITQEPLALSPSGSTERLPVDLPPQARHTIENGTELQAIKHMIKHNTHVDAIEIIITPYKYEKYIVLILQANLKAQFLPKDIVHNSLLSVQSKPLAEAASTIYGDDWNRIRWYNKPRSLVELN